MYWTSVALSRSVASSSAWRGFMRRCRTRRGSSPLGGDDADVLALCFRAFAGTAGDAELDLVRRAQALVAVLQFNGQADGIVDAVAAPGRADAGFHRAQRLAVGVARFETGRDQLFPDQRQLLDAGTEHVDACAAGDLGVQAVLLGHRADRDQAVCRHLAARHARHHGVGARPSGYCRGSSRWCPAGWRVPSSARSRSIPTPGCWRRAACKRRSPSPCRACAAGRRRS